MSFHLTTEFAAAQENSQPCDDTNHSRGSSVSEDAELWARYAECGPGSEVEGELVEKYLDLVNIVVGRIAISLPAHVDRDDLHSVGLAGLLDAVRRYSTDNGASFNTYARLRIRGAIFDELRRLDWVPRSVHEKARKLQEVMRRLEQEIGDVPTEEEIAEAMNLSLKEYRQLVLEVRPATFVSLDSVRGAVETDGVMSSEVLADEQVRSPDEASQVQENVELLARRIEQLPDAQRKVLALYYFEDLTLREIATAFGVSESRICQIHGQAILALKNAFQKDREETDRGSTLRASSSRRLGSRNSGSRRPGNRSKKPVCSPRHIEGLEILSLPQVDMSARRAA